MDSLLAPDAPPILTPLLRTLVLCDLADSTALIEQLGDVRAGALLQRHDQALLRLVGEHQGQLIDKADGALVLFERPIQGLAFALAYQRALHELSTAEKLSLRARIGIHVGDVMTWSSAAHDVAAGAKPLEVEGLAKPVAARLMHLALPGQILLSGMAQTLAMRAQGELGERAAKLRWRMHGRYRFKGVPVPMLVHEVGDADIAPFHAPPSGEKAWRELPVWRRTPVLALEFALVSLFVVGALWTYLRSPPALAFNERDWVVLGDLQNHTSEATFDDALDTAFRVGLEQSRYVNVVSELQVRDGLARMQHTGQAVDRQVGSELAVREGARALILPTVAEVGGQLRVSAEVIDPNTGVTVYSETATSRNPGNVLPALDDVLDRLRGRLGESVASIEKTSKPLEQVTTSNLGALRAYSLAQKARIEARNDDALALYQRAVQLDPEFAMAYLRLGFIAYSANDTEGTRRYLDLAQLKRSHLSDREALLLDAGLAIFITPEQAMRRFKLLAEMYPDEYRAYYNYSFFAYNDAQLYQAALDFMAPATVPQNPARRNAYYQLGKLNLALEQYAPALEAFEQADSLGVRGFKRHYAETYAAMRRYPLAMRVLASQTPNGDVNQDLEQRLDEISFPADQGQWPQALRAAAELESLAAKAAPLTRWTYRGVRLSLRSYDPDANFRGDLQAYLKEQTAALATANVLDRRHLLFEILAAGWMAAHTGDRESAKEALRTAEDAVQTAGFPANRDMALLVRAELDLADGKSEAVIAALRPRVERGDELYFLHAVLMRAYALGKQYDAALTQADWLATHRGRAYGEFNSECIWQPANVIESDLAMQAAARYADRLGQSDLAKKKQAAFLAAWRGGDKLTVVARRAASD